jgi:hypothetical protein
MNPTQGRCSWNIDNTLIRQTYGAAGAAAGTAAAATAVVVVAAMDVPLSASVSHTMCALSRRAARVSPAVCHGAPKRCQVALELPGSQRLYVEQAKLLK